MSSIKSYYTQRKLLNIEQMTNVTMTSSASMTSSSMIPTTITTTTTTPAPPPPYMKPNVRGCSDEAQLPFECSYGSRKEKLTAFLLSFFVGEFGADRFYLGFITMGVFKLLTCGACGVWWLIDWILILASAVMHDGNGCCILDW